MPPSATPPSPASSTTSAWPRTLWLIRHGQSAGNVARDAAEAGGLPVIDLAWRDIDVPLSDLGVEQATAVGEWFGRLPRDEQPEVILCSPYVRARETARLLAESAGLGAAQGVRLRIDERLREKEFGVRLWVDDLASFSRICPDIAPGVESQHSRGVEVRWWREPFPAVEPADVVVEAFACNPPADYVAAMAARQPKPAWINLEYLSAEDWVRGCHGLPSPHPSLPPVKHFFFPGFSAGTGGLLAEQGLAQARERFQRSGAEQARLWQDLGFPAPRAGELQVSLFCYPQSGTGALLRAFAAGATPVRCLVPEGIATQALSEFFEVDSPAPGAVLRKAGLEVRIFPFLDQDRYDQLLWACDFNLVRGEDSFVRAQWAARPLVWQIYAQQEGAHWPKLQAFLALYCAGLPPAAAAAVTRLWQAWNRGAAGEIEAAWPDYCGNRLELQAHARRWAERLGQAGDLANNLAQFCENLL